MKVRRGQRELVIAMDTTEVADAEFNDSMYDFDADGMEEKTTRTDPEPDVLEVEVGDNFDPDFCGKIRETWVKNGN